MSKGKDVIEFRKRIKIALVKAFGSKCQRCGEEHSVGVFDFHHLNPNEKSFSLGSGSTTRAKSSYAEEARKCVMLCANCYRYVENDGVDVSDLVCTFDEKVYYDTIDELTNKQKALVEQRQEQREALKAEKPLMYKPTREQLKADIRSMPMVQVGSKYLVSDNAVRKWCKSYNLPARVCDIKKYSDEEWENI